MSPCASSPEQVDYSSALSKHRDFIRHMFMFNQGSLDSIVIVKYVSRFMIHYI